MNELTKLLKMLRNSETLKIKYGWSREVGAGFVAEDLNNISLSPTLPNTLTLHTESFTQTVKTKDLNLRETQEAIRFLEQQQHKQIIEQHTKQLIQ